ncbi:MAG: UDP-2,4-diacetamido-2,4,6-trideoxy-beta-L-altropyranose hydrolase [Bacteroidales bacterium]
MSASPILIRCDASTLVGTGHVMRCLTLAEAMAGREVWFACAEITKPLAERVRQRGHRLVAVPGPRGGDADLSATLELLGQCGGAVLDGYAYGAEYRRAVAGAGRPVLALDDTGEVRLHAQLIANPSPAAHPALYAAEPGAELLLGPAYALVAAPLLEARAQPGGGAHSLLVTFGGSDPLGLTLPVTRALATKLGAGCLHVVVGGSVAGRDGVAAELRALGVRGEVDVRAMGPLLRGCRLAVSAGGSTLYELAALGRAMVLVVVADNQDAAARQAACDGWAVSIDGRAADGVEGIVQAAVALWRDGDRLAALGQAAERRVDGEGARRVAGRFLAKLV